jgi:hypothetical protein
MMTAAAAMTTAANASTTIVPASGLSRRKLSITLEKVITREILRKGKLAYLTECPFDCREALREEGLSRLIIGDKPSSAGPPINGIPASLITIYSMD